jgi:hypothetical protein
MPSASNPRKNHNRNVCSRMADCHRRQAEPDHALDQARQQKGPRRGGKDR